ncbi:MAG: hypothetical protein ABFC96_08145 [Thermoguttaceae bacterium]
MHDLDFLPSEFRRKQQRRQSQPWLIVASTAVVGLVAAAAIAQHYRWRNVQAELAAVEPAYETAVHLQSQLAGIEKRVGEARAAAELYTYLRHPWPRTQLLSALLQPLPKEIAFQQVHVFRQPASTRPGAATAAAPDKKAEEERLKAMPPAARDLASFRARLDPMHTVVVLSGTAAADAPLHRYLGVLDATDIFDKAELDCFNSVDGDKTIASLQFRALLVVEPGYGQPGGPTGPPKKSLAQK